MTVPNVWYWAACALFTFSSGLIIFLIRRQDKRVDEAEKCMQELKREFSGFSGSCKERHKSIEQSLATGRKTFETIEQDIKKLIERRV